MKKFEIKPEYLTSIIVKTDYSLGMSEEERILLKLKGHVHTSVRTDDHPEFVKLRELLGQEGYITIERGWWNGDIVEKPFSLNGAKFKKGGRFACGSAIGYIIETKLKKQEQKKRNKQDNVDKCIALVA